MAKKAKKILPELQVWIDARERHHLSHAHIHMARELGMNPKKFGGKDNHRQELWKAPLPDFIERLYRKHFGVERPAVVQTIEEVAAARIAKKEARTERRRAEVAARSLQPAAPGENPSGEDPHAADGSA